MSARLKYRGPRAAAALAAAALLCAASTGTARAEAGAIRLGAGEHDGYSRIVVNGGPRGGWSLQAGERRFDLRLPGRNLDIDAAAVTRWRRAHRVAALAMRREGRETVLSFALNCSCSAKARVDRAGRIVIDVSPRTDAGAAEAEGRIETATIKPATAPLDVEGARSFLMAQLQRAAEQGLIRYKDEPAASPAPTPASRPEEAEDAVAAAAADVLSAADAGDAADPADAPKPAAARPREERPADVARTAAPSPEAPIETGPSARQAEAGPRSTSSPRAAPPSAERPAAAQPQRAPATAPEPEPELAATQQDEEIAEAAPPPPCPADALLDMSAWPVNEPYFDALAERRAALFDGLNRVDPEAVAALQTLYLAQGFGHEAAAAPTAFDVMDEQIAILAAMGDALAGRRPEIGSALNRDEPCLGRQALWQAAALADFEPARAVAAYRQAGRTLRRAPGAMRRLLGERVAFAAARSGALDVAADILALLQRSKREPTPIMRVVAAELALAEGRTVAAQVALEEVARSRDAAALTAALRLAPSFDQPYDAGRALDLADMLADFALQRRGGPDMLAAAMAEARLRARYGQLPQALTAIDVTKRYGRYGAAELEALRIELLDDAIAALPETPLTSGDAETEAALARAAELVTLASALDESAENDRIRTDLAERVTALRAPHLARLLIDDGLSTRSDRASAVREAALEASALIDPLGSVAGGLDALSGGSRIADPDFLASLETADALPSDYPNRSETEAVEEAAAPAIDPLEPLRRGRGQARAADTIEDGQDLLNDIDADLEVIRQLTTDRVDVSPPHKKEQADG